MPKRRRPAPVDTLPALARALAQAYLDQARTTERLEQWQEAHPGQEPPESMENPWARAAARMDEAIEQCASRMDEVMEHLLDHAEAFGLEILDAPRLGAAIIATVLAGDLVPPVPSPGDEPPLALARPVLVGVPVFADRRSLASLDLSALASSFRGTGMAPEHSNVAVLGVAPVRELMDLLHRPGAIVRWRDRCMASPDLLAPLDEGLLQPLDELDAAARAWPADTVVMDTHVIVVAITAASPDPDAELVIPACDGLLDTPEDDRIAKRWEQAMEALEPSGTNGPVSFSSEPMALPTALHDALALSMVMPLIVQRQTAHPDREAAPLVRMALAMDPENDAALQVVGVFEDGFSATALVSPMVTAYLDPVADFLPVSPELLLAQDLPQWLKAWGHDESVPRPRRLN